MRVGVAPAPRRPSPNIPGRERIDSILVCRAAWRVRFVDLPRPALGSFRSFATPCPSENRPSLPARAYPEASRSHGALNDLTYVMALNFVISYGLVLGSFRRFATVRGGFVSSIGRVPRVVLDPCAHGRNDSLVEHDQRHPSGRPSHPRRVRFVDWPRLAKAAPKRPFESARLSRPPIFMGSGEIQQLSRQLASQLRRAPRWVRFAVWSGGYAPRLCASSCQRIAGENALRRKYRRPGPSRSARIFRPRGGWLGLSRCKPPMPPAIRLPDDNGPMIRPTLPRRKRSGTFGAWRAT